MNRQHFTAKRSLISLYVQHAVSVIADEFNRKPKVKHARHRHRRD
jgi:hypothetical protein